MASSLIAGSIVILMILIGGYVIAAGILTIAESTMNSQIEMSGIEDKTRQSSMEIDTTQVGIDGTKWFLIMNLINSGSTTYGGTDFSKMDLFIYDSVTIPKNTTRYTTTTTPHYDYSILDDLTNRNMWDPSETLQVRINYTDSVIPNWTKFVAPNGISASKNL
ncbi:MAG TPA: hypothetical protein VN372_14475 [Methanospirillum sp.]|nr:hypothetical protein [Methanospirillum sp.]